MKQPKARGTSVAIANFKAQEAIKPKHVVIQRYPTPPARFHVPDDFRGAFQLAGVGRDVETGRGW